MFSTADVKVANATSRAAGAVGARAIVPRVVQYIAKPSDTILDFGSGHAAQHALRLRQAGLTVTAHEFGDNVRPGLHAPDALAYTYDIVYASNVLNVQSSVAMLKTTIRQLHEACAWGGIVICNYPQSPRKAGLKPSEVRAELRRQFSVVERVAGTSSAPVWECRP